MDDWDKNANSISGSLLGTAIGDALGLPYEGLTGNYPHRGAFFSTIAGHRGAISRLSSMYSFH